ncbi:unnamed protein product [Brachionus calyciflorus]|uniref:Uncharacterized protein n=1 Tax=Brachionus calyciflorus TaxID=104777 RepID=A0A814D297_9BILA|nr:unnamed protein product [Brachionus calyciflorus]
MEETASTPEEIGQDEVDLETIRLTRSRALREQVNSNQDIAVEKMCKKHDRKRNKRTVLFKKGDCVSLKIPSIDVGGSELSRLPCIVKEMIHDKYQLVCEYGIIESHLRIEELELYSGLLEFEVDKVTEMISIRAAAALAGNRTKAIKEIEVECDCTGKCNTKQCKCIKANLKCNSHCHRKKSVDSKSCLNRN